MFNLRSLYIDKEFMYEDKVCKVCRVMYKTIEALGKLQCRYHPGTPYEDQSLRYSCCGQPLDVKDRAYRKQLRFGCTPADHTILDRPYRECDGLNTVEYPPNTLLNSNSIITYNRRASTHTLWRYDRIQAEYRIQYGTYDRDVDQRLKYDSRTEEGAALGLDIDDEENFEFSCSDDEGESQGDDTDTESDTDIPLFLDRDNDDDTVQRNFTF